jgi:hypothetical protein
MAKRASKMEQLHRMDQAFQLMVRGIPSAQTIRMLVHEHGISERTAKRDIAAAKEYLNACGQQPRFENINLIKHRIEFLYSKTALAGDVEQMHKNLGLQLKCFSELAKLEESTSASASPTTVSDTLAGLFEEAKKRPK